MTSLHRFIDPVNHIACAHDVWAYRDGSNVGIQITLARPGPDRPMAVRMGHTEAIIMACSILKKYRVSFNGRDVVEPDEEPPPAPTATDGEVLLTPAEVGKAFGVDPKTVWRWAKAGRIPSYRTPTGQRRYRATDVQAALAGGRP